MSADATPIVSLKNISKQFPGVLALDDVSVDIFPGEVHAFLGENGAGKSTVMNILAGEIQPTEGEIYYKGQRREIHNPLVSQQMGISVVYQELALCGNLTIAENISLSTVSKKSGLALINRGRFRTAARDALARLGLENININQVVGQLSVAQQQMVEIAKALSLKAEVLILDEPNSALTIEETEHLFKVIRQLREQGVAIIYVSHRLEEVVQIADRITILRDGRRIDTELNRPDLTLDGIIAKMVGREVDRYFESAIEVTAQESIALEVDAISAEGALQDISFKLHKGEILGIAGLPDSGKDELVDSLFGLRSHRGSIRIQGKAVAATNPAAVIQEGMALIPADRRGAGAILVMSVEDNTVVSTLGSVSQLGFLRRSAIRALSKDYVNQLDTKVSSLKQKMATLSGGNQQKVILSRGLATQPSVLVLHEPTRGIDVGAKAEIYMILQRLAREGVAILVVSSELPELISQCDRILVLHSGVLRGEFDHMEADEEKILACAMGQATHLN